MDRLPGRFTAPVWGVLMVVAAQGCVGAIDEGQSPSAPTPGRTTTTAMPSAPAAIAGFTVPVEQLRLLPYAVRFSRVVAVAGAPSSDPMFELLRTNRTLLGDHDFASGVKPDVTWSALRISEWVRAVKPVCASVAMRVRYPALPANLGALVEAAFGRTPRPEDATAIKDSLTGLTLDEKAQYQGICVAVLSSLEFLAQ